MNDYDLEILSACNCGLACNCTPQIWNISQIFHTHFNSVSDQRSYSWTQTLRCDRKCLKKEKETQKDSSSCQQFFMLWIMEVSKSLILSQRSGVQGGSGVHCQRFWIALPTSNRARSILRVVLLKNVFYFLFLLSKSYFIGTLLSSRPKQCVLCQLKAFGVYLSIYLSIIYIIYCSVDRGVDRFFIYNSTIVQNIILTVWIFYVCIIF